MCYIVVYQLRVEALGAGAVTTGVRALMNSHLRLDQRILVRPSKSLYAAELLRNAFEPNLFIIGSMKSGTTYLYNLLASQPSIFMCRPKEPSYFVEPDQLRKLWPWGWEQGYCRNRERYVRLFQSAGTRTILGEASVYYTHLPLASGVAERIHQFNPDARLIYVMRDPIERTISHYWHRVRHHREHRSLLPAIRDDSQYRDVSNYAMQLSPYLERFKQDQIKLLTFEELTGNTNETLRSIFRWLKLDESIASVTIQPDNVTPEIVRKSIWMLHRLRQDNQLLCAAIDRLPSCVRRFGARMLTREVDRRNVDISEVVRYLRPLQQRQTEVLTKLIGREFPEWKTLYPRVTEQFDRPVNLLVSRTNASGRKC